MRAHSSVRSTALGLWVGSLVLLGCDPSGGEGAAPLEVAEAQKEVGPPSADQVPLDPATIPRFAHELPIPRTFAPTEIRSGGQVIRHEYTVSVAQTLVQALPPGFPATTVFAYGGRVKIPGSSGTELVRSVPGPIFDNTRGIPTVVRWRNEIIGPHFLPIDPTLHWANPNTLELPGAPFLPFPMGYLAAQLPVGIVTHNHGLVVTPQNDGIAEQWFTAGPHRGPSFVTRDYFKPNEQPGTQLFYHDHTMGMTRVSLFAGLAGSAYYIRDPASPLDQPSSPLPRGEFEIPLVIFDRAFFTDGELNFPRTGANLKNPYWQAGDGANVILVNGKVWPNLDVQRRQYRFRTLAIGNGRLFNITLDNAGVPVAFTIIGSDGGYLPVPQVVTTVAIATTERADLLVDFSSFPAGTQIIMRNAGATPADTLGTIMRFTVVDSPQVAPPPTPPLVARPELIPDAPPRIKTLHNHIDADGDAQRSVDGLEFSVPPTEFPLVGSTEQWDLVNAGGGPHQIHLHLIEFQLLNRQTIDTAAYMRRWHLLNGHRPVTRPIVVDPTPFLTGPVLPPLPYETGWKDTIRANSGQVMRLRARWAPQEIPAGGVSPGENRFPIDPVSPTTSDWYLWHCHVLGHEDNDMMRKLPLVNAWRPGASYQPGTVVAHDDVNYRVRVAHGSTSSQPPGARFDLWERVNNNDGSWQPQIIYAVGDRVLHDDALFIARSVHQALPGQPPDANPALWTSLPMDACGQLAQLCADDPEPDGVDCQNLGVAGDEASCLAGLDACLARCDEHVQSPCSGLCNDPTSFAVPDLSVFNSGPLGSGAGCFETEAEILSGRCTGFGGGRRLTINGRAVTCNGTPWAYPLPPQRNLGYCIQTTAGVSPNASFQVF
jgi:FtsP/CotA-like multicopper oxidase with cupredoxin domain